MGWKKQGRCYKCLLKSRAEAQKQRHEGTLEEKHNWGKKSNCTINEYHFNAKLKYITRFGIRCGLIRHTVRKWEGKKCSSFRTLWRPSWKVNPELINMNISVWTGHTLPLIWACPLHLSIILKHHRRWLRTAGDVLGNRAHITANMGQLHTLVLSYIREVTL